VLASRNNPQDVESRGSIPVEQLHEGDTEREPGKLIAVPTARAGHIADIARTIALWREWRLTPSLVWHALTGERRRYVAWGQVEDFMIGWQTSRVRVRSVA